MQCGALPPPHPAPGSPRALAPLCPPHPARTAGSRGFAHRSRAAKALSQPWLGDQQVSIGWARQPWHHCGRGTKEELGLGSARPSALPTTFVCSRHEIPSAPWHGAHVAAGIGVLGEGGAGAMPGASPGAPRSLEPHAGCSFSSCRGGLERRDQCLGFPWVRRDREMSKALTPLGC